MQLAFESFEIREICENEEIASDKYGTEITWMLHKRLADLRAISSIKEILVGKPESFNDNSRFKIDLCDGFRLIFCANHVNNPVGEEGGIDWFKVGRIKILAIEKL